MNATEPSLYDRLGGEPAIVAITQAFYGRVMEDIELKPFFAHTLMDKQVAMQNAFLCQALGGPMIYTGKSLAHAHQGRGIGTQHFAKFVQHFLETLKEHGVSNEDADAVISRLNTLSNEITNKSY
jgi:hemoglobin